jgi:NSS family neurotransmitter:Na+ symporter
VLASYVILTYYGLISGWALKYFAAFAGGGFPAAPGAAGGYFAAFTAASVEPIVWQGIVMLLAASIVIGGIERGIERASKFLMPVLALIVVALAVHSLLLPDAGRGLAFLFGPDWSALAEPRVYLAALGQTFFSLGLAMGVLVTYGSYLPGHFPLPKAALTIVAGDTLFAIVAAVVIFPAVFSFGMSPDQGPGLAFVTLPEIFARMNGGVAVGIMFFGLLVLAAMTSLVALIEIPAAYAIERWGLDRRKAVALVAGSAFLLGVPNSLGFGLLSHVRIAGAAILDGVDFLASSALLPASGLAIALFAGWHWARADAVAASGLAAPWLARLWWLAIRYLAPAMIAVVLLRSLGVI